MKKIGKALLFFVALVTMISIFVIPRIVSKFQGTKLDWEKKTGEVYYCPMHPSYVSDRPGDCPICYMKLVPKSDASQKKERKVLYYRHPMGEPDISPVPKKDAMGMDYIPVYEEEITGRPSQVPGRATIQLPLARQQLIGVKLGRVEKRKLVKEIRTTGRVAYDPELFTAQQEFLSAIESLKKSEAGPYHEPLERSKALVESVRTRLRLLGMSEPEIEELEKQAIQDRNLILPEAVIARSAEGVPPRNDGPWVWVYGTIYEYELPLVKVGAPVRVRVPTWPEKEFGGEIRTLDPVLDPLTRSLRIRAKVKDPEALLRPEMYVDLYLEVDLGEVLALPEEAVMHTGERTLVFVKQGEGDFEPREIKLGTKAKNFYEVRSGLQTGEEVVINGNFLIDSESRLQAALQGLTGPSEGEGHVHAQ